MRLQVSTILLRVPEPIYDASGDDRVLNGLVHFQFHIFCLMDVRLESLNDEDEVLMQMFR